MKKKADCRLVDGGFNEKGNLYTRCVLSGHKTQKSLHLPTKIVNVCIEVLMGFSIQSDDTNNTLLSQGYCF